MYREQRQGKTAMDFSREKKHIIPLSLYVFLFEWEGQIQLQWIVPIPCHTQRKKIVQIIYRWSSHCNYSTRATRWMLLKCETNKQKQTSPTQPPASVGSPEKSFSFFSKFFHCFGWWIWVDRKGRRLHLLLRHFDGGIHSTRPTGKTLIRLPADIEHAIGQKLCKLQKCRNMHGHRAHRTSLHAVW